MGACVHMTLGDWAGARIAARCEGGVRLSTVVDTPASKIASVTRHYLMHLGVQTTTLANQLHPFDGPYHPLDRDSTLTLVGARRESVTKTQNFASNSPASHMPRFSHTSFKTNMYRF